MKAILVLAAILLIVMAISGCISSTSGNIANSSYAHYVNRTSGFSMDYPKNWSVQDQPYNMTVLYPPNDTVMGDNVTRIIIQYGNGLVSTGGPVTLDDYTKYAVMAPRHDNPSSQVKDISWNNILLSGLPAIEYTYTDTQNNTSIKGLLVYTVAGNTHYYDTANKEWVYAGKTYTIEYIAKEEAFDKYNGDVKNIENSFKISTAS